MTANRVDYLALRSMADELDDIGSKLQSKRVGQLGARLAAMSAQLHEFALEKVLYHPDDTGWQAWSPYTRGRPGGKGADPLVDVQFQDGTYSFGQLASHWTPEPPALDRWHVRTHTWSPHAIVVWRPARPHPFT